MNALSAAINSIITRSSFAGARFGIAVRDLESGEVVFAQAAHEIFQAASTTKLLTTAYALQWLGADYRFRTRIVHASRVDTDGTLDGDLILVAAGDPNLSGRVTDHDTLDFEDMDHANARAADAPLVGRDPLHIIERLAAAVRAAGVRRVTGRVVIDIGLFPEGYREPGTFTTVSPIAVNDNQIDIYLRGGEQPGDPVTLRAIPSSGYVRFVNRATTSRPDARADIHFSNERPAADGGWEVEVTGSQPAASGQMTKFGVESPSRFARTVLTEALASAGVVVEGGLAGPSTLEGAASADATVLAEHVSPPLSEVTKVVLKVSQNLHAEMLPHVVGAVVKGAPGVAAGRAGYAAGADMLATWNVDTTGAFQGDGCGAYGYFSPDFMTRFLVSVRARPIYDALVYGLPLMGRDGTLSNVETTSPAAGHVRAKTGTLVFDDRIHDAILFTTKALAGYVTAASGREYAFAFYLNNFYRERTSSVSPGQTLGELASVLYTHL